MSMSSHSTNITFIICFLLLTFVVSTFAQNAPPKARTENVTGDYFGQKIVDPYRWMENEKDPEFVGFLKAQADYARAMLDKLPLRKELLERIGKLDAAAPSSAFEVERLAAGTNTFI